jgi:hypothetical protein
MTTVRLCGLSLYAALLYCRVGTREKMRDGGEYL